MGRTAFRLLLFKGEGAMSVDVPLAAVLMTERATGPEMDAASGNETGSARRLQLTQSGQALLAPITGRYRSSIAVLP